MFNLLDSKQIRKFTILQILVVATAIFESISVIAIVPLMTAITDPVSLNSNKAYLIFCHNFNLISVESFIKWYSLFFLSILLFANVLSIFTIWLLSKFAANFGATLSNRLFSFYLTINYSSFITLGNSYMTKQISTEVSRLTDNVLQPFVQINARIISAIFICLILFFYNPYASLLSISVFSIAYSIIYYFVKKRLKNNGKDLSDINQIRFTYISEGFGAFREIKSFGITDLFISRFSNSSNAFAKSYSILNTIYNAPRYIIEFFVFATLVLLIYKFNNSNNSAQLLSIISVLGLASIKLLPIFQQIYSCIAQIRGHRNALDLIYRDLTNNLFSNDVHKNYSFNSQMNLELFNGSKNILRFENVSFGFQKEVNILNNITIDFERGKLNAIVGKSGAGKSTISDIATGLFLPHAGKLYFFDEIINLNNLQILRSNVSLVPQSTFILKGTLAENITFCFDDQIDIDRLNLVIQQSDLLNLVTSLPNGIFTVVGDGNLLLSGGEKQRISIARALYRESQILFFDEPTSSLDPESEAKIVKLINSLVPNKTVITISHKFSTIENYDNVFLIEGGEIKNLGNPLNNSIDSEKFKKIMLQ